VEEMSLNTLVRLHLSAVFKFDFSGDYLITLSVLRLYSITWYDDKERTGEDL
jgi:hypothetical protein